MSKANRTPRQVVRDFHIIVRMETQRNGAGLALRLASDLPRVNGDPVQLQQVLLNLARNAAEAMASFEPGAREVVIGTSATAPHPDYCIDRGCGTHDR
jgi:C4-dicarboxylate-specific signal transduction histidine kinase